MSLIGLTGKILCQVPSEYRWKLAKGALKLTGCVLRDAKTGRIVGFLQETKAIRGPLLQAGRRFGAVSAATGNPTVGAAAAVASLAMEAGALVQGEILRAGVNRVEQGVARVEEGVARIESKLEGTDEKLNSLAVGMELLTNMGIANLALSATGVGVSVVGFGVLASRLEGVQHSVRALGQNIEAVGARIERVRQELIDADFSEVLSLGRRYEEAWELSGEGRAEDLWMRVAYDARTYQDRFAWRARDLIMAGPENIAAADTMLDAVAITSGLRFAALSACNETALAKTIADEAATQIESLTGAIGLRELLTPETMAQWEPGTGDYKAGIASASEAARPLLKKLRDREAAAATISAPLGILEQRKIAPREWLAEARKEDGEAILMLTSDNTDKP